MKCHPMRYINPRNTRGFKDSFIAILAQTPVISAAKFAQDYGIVLDVKHPERAIEQICNVLKVEAIGTSPKKAYEYAYAQAKRLYTLSDVYETAHSALWDRLNMQELCFVAVNLETTKNDILYVAYV